jgi:hypothetical protein
MDGHRTDANRYFVGEVSPEEYYKAKQELSQRKKQRPVPPTVLYLPTLFTTVMKGILLLLIFCYL